MSFVGVSWVFVGVISRGEMCLAVRLKFLIATTARGFSSLNHLNFQKYFELSTHSTVPSTCIRVKHYLMYL